MELTIKFRSDEEAARCDLTRIGIVAGGSDDGLTAKVELDFADDDLHEAIASALASCGIFAEVS